MNSNKLSFWGTKFFETLTQPKFFASAPAVKEIYRALKSLMVFALWKTRTLVEQLKIHAQIISTWFFSLAMLMKSEKPFSPMLINYVWWLRYFVLKAFTKSGQSWWMEFISTPRVYFLNHLLLILALKKTRTSRKAKS